MLRSRVVARLTRVSEPDWLPRLRVLEQMAARELALVRVVQASVWAPPELALPEQEQSTLLRAPQVGLTLFRAWHAAKLRRRVRDHQRQREVFAMQVLARVALPLPVPVSRRA